jgi:NADH-quinone oxidoreductase subunit F
MTTRWLPHALAVLVLIAGLSVDAHAGYVYIRGEYRYLIEVMEKAIAEAYEKGWLGKNIQGTGFDFELYTHTGAGAYECGEESALLESLEGKRGIPRIRPPFPAVSGAFQCPTVLNNVETFCAVPAIIRDGGAAFAALGVPKAGGTKLTCLTGHVNKPGVYELTLGFPVKQMIEEVGGGMRHGKKLKAFIPGGSSCPILTAAELEGATMEESVVVNAGGREHRENGCEMGRGQRGRLPSLVMMESSPVRVLVPYLGGRIPPTSTETRAFGPERPCR